MPKTETYWNPNTKRTETRKTSTGAEADAAVAKAGFQDVSPLAAAARKAKEKKKAAGMTGADAAAALAKRKREDD